MLTKTLMRAASAARPSPIAGLRTMAALRASSTSTSTTTATSEADAYSLLVEQRKRRPLAPHLSIYQPQLTWYMSGSHRLTGILIAAPVYLFGIAYATAPTLGLALDSASIAASMAALPLVAKLAIKTTVAFPFVYHCINGVRHVTWDTTKFLNMPGVYATGYTVLGLTAAATGYLAFAV